MAFSGRHLKQLAERGIDFGNPAKWRWDMWRKFLVALGFAVVVGAGVGAAPAPASAQVGFGIHIGGPGYYDHGPRYAPPRYGPPRHHYRGHRYRDRHYRHHRPQRCDRVVTRQWDGYGWRRVVQRRCYR